MSNSFSRFAVDGQYAITFLYSTITVGQCARNDFVHLKEQGKKVQLFYHDALTFHTLLELSFLPQNPI